MKEKNKIKKVSGYILLGLSILFYSFIFLLPFVDYFPSLKIKFGVAFYILSYIFMFAGFWLLGKELALKIKQKLKNIFKFKKSV